MFTSKFDFLRLQKQQAESRKITLSIISEETGLAVNTIQRIRKGDVEKMYLSSIVEMCRYFGVGKIDDLIEYTPDEVKS